MSSALVHLVVLVPQSFTTNLSAGIRPKSLLDGKNEGRRTIDDADSIGERCPPKLETQLRKAHPLMLQQRILILCRNVQR